MAVDLRLLHALVVLGEEGHVGRAAARLSLTQPALSKQLAQLERMTGLALFVRHPRGVSPTPSGSLLIERARRVLDEAEGFDSVVEQARRGVTGRLLLGFVGQALNEHTSVVLRILGERHPGVEVEMRQFDMTDLTAGLDSGSTDLGFLRLPVSAPRLHHEPVLVEPRVAVLPADHPLAGRESVRVAELFGEPWVVTASADPAYRRFALGGSGRGADVPRLGPVVRNIDEYLEAVLAHRGVGLAPASAARFYARPGVAYVPVPDAEPSVAAVSYSTERALLPAARALLRIVTAQLPVAGDPRGR